MTSSNSENYIYSTFPIDTTIEPNISSSIYSIITTNPTISQAEIYSSTGNLVLTTYINSVNTITTYINFLTTEINKESIELTIIPDQNKNIESTYFDTDVISNSKTIILEIPDESIKNLTKDNIMEKISSIIEDIKIGNVYQKKCDDFSILIYPTNSTYLTLMTHVNFTECENILRKHYKIPDSEIMTFLQIELENDNSKSLINQVEYQALDGNKTFLNLSLCENANIQIIYSIKNKSLIDIDSVNYFKQNGIDIFNINDSFFNDICEPYSDTDSGDDVILEDRIKTIFKNYSLCEAGCNYEKIDLEIMAISCQCRVKENISNVITPINIQKTGGGSSTNFEIIKCYNLVFSFNGKLHNIGFWILGFLVLLHGPILFYYFTKGIKPVRDYIIKEMKTYGYIKVNRNLKSKKKKKSNAPPKKKNIRKEIIKAQNNKNIEIKNLKIVNNSSSINILKSSKRDIIPQINQNKNSKKSGKKANKNNNFNKKDSTKIKLKSKVKKLISEKKKTKNIAFLPTKDFSINQKEEKTNNLKDFTLINIDLNFSHKKKHIPPESHIILNNYTFEEALKYDHRQLCEIFYIFALVKQIFFYTFLYRSPLVLFPLRLCLLIFIISSDLSLNALFYFNENISKKYRSGKNLFLFTFSDNVIIIFLSTFVGFILLTLLSKLSNFTNNIREIFKNEETKLKKDKNYIINEQRKKEIILEIDNILKKYKLRVIILLIVEMIFMLFFWYFVIAFCHVYKATQKSWLLDSCLSILFRAIIELLISFILAKIYKISISGETECIYKCVMFLYNFG